MLKLFLKLPLVTKIVLKNDKKSMEIDRHIEYNRVTWHGEVHREVLCTYVDTIPPQDCVFWQKYKAVEPQVIIGG